MDVKEIFMELIKEALNGKVVIDNEIWPVSFNTIINDTNNTKYYLEENMAQLEINNLDKFIKKLSEYISLEQGINRKTFRLSNNDKYNHIKLLMAYLFVNATTEDFRDPLGYIERYIGYLKDQTFANLDNGVEINLGGIFMGNKLVLKNVTQSVMMETPHKIEISIASMDNPDLVFQLPEISYGINDQQCYIYSILNKENMEGTIEQKRYKKQISRKLYKMNDGISALESDEFRDYQNGISDYYPENITDVSVSAVLSLNVFVSLLKTKKIECIKMVPYLPLRYFSRYSSAKSSSKKEELLNRNDYIQYNLTNKFIRTMMRLSMHDSSLNVVSFPYENDEYLTVQLVPGKIDKDILLGSVSESIDYKMKK